MAIAGHSDIQIFTQIHNNNAYICFENKKKKMKINNTEKCP